jgi:TIR domain
MMDVHCNVLSGKTHWRIATSSSGVVEDVVRLCFSTAGFTTVSERDAYETIRAVLRHEDVAWVEPSLQEWRVNLQGLSVLIGRPDVVPWLNGTVNVKPEFKSEILSLGPPRVGSGDFVFYITPDTVSESASKEAVGTMPARKEVFISYSHTDRKWVDRVRVHLRPLEREGLLELFDDSKIKPGGRWREEISGALDRARVAVLLISADFIASDFIANNELPPLLKKAEAGGAMIIPVIVSPCGFLREKKLSGYQSVNNPSKSLTSVGYSEREQILTKLAEAVEEALGNVRAGVSVGAANEVAAQGKKTHTEVKMKEAKELLQLIESEADPENRGLTEIFNSIEPGQIFFVPALRDRGTVYSMKSRIFKEAVAELVSSGWLYPPEDTGRTRLYEFKPRA